MSIVTTRPVGPAWPARSPRGSATAGAPIPAASARVAKEQGRAECDQEQRADQVGHPDRDETQVPGHADQTDDDDSGRICARLECEARLCGARAMATHNIRDVGRGELRWQTLEVLTPAQFLERYP
ncbi:MAG: hypothetical protein KGJ85_01045 [Betaproteobacteria bacterium]|nr:hypothetical protein [Betaproteobacteria bacterium]MDE2150892.1 hypothetical protein [Betaproteobacteria bacterium]